MLRNLKEIQSSLEKYSSRIDVTIDEAQEITKTDRTELRSFDKDADILQE